MQRAIWLITFIIIIAGAYYYVIIHDADVKAVSKVTERLELQSDNINTITEEQSRLELRYIGHGKHLKSIQDEFKAHFEAYTKKMAEIDNQFETVEYSIEGLGERLTKKIDQVETDLEDTMDDIEGDVSDLFNDVQGLEKKLLNTETDINTINNLLNKIKEKVDLDD